MVASSTPPEVIMLEKKECQVHIEPGILVVKVVGDTGFEPVTSTV